MGGGLLQLTIEGQMNIPLFYNPRISFFSYAYKKHTNFAIENMRKDFKSPAKSISTMHNTGENTVILTDNQNVDLLSNLYFVFKVPDIYSDDKLKFKWVENFGSLIIKKAYLKIDKNTIDSITGEWIVVWNELSMPVKDGFNNMTGNIPDLLNPRKKETIIRIKNNIVSEYDYASSSLTDLNDNPSIKGRYITVPLPFWFSKNPSLALPILKFCRTHIASVEIEFENIENLYTVYSDIYNMHISPTYYNKLYNKHISFTNFVKEKVGNDFVGYIEATYIVLDCYERQSIINKANIEFLIETLNIKEDKVISGGPESIRQIELKSQLLVKEIIWTLNRADSVYKFNNVCNYSYSIPANNENSIMQLATIIWDKGSLTRVDLKDSYFYNNIQPYQHHSTIPRQGIYCYSFSIFPEKWFPSGCFNAAGVNTILSITLNKYKPSLIDEIYMKKFNSTYKMDDDNNDIIIRVYMVQYNILGIISGNIGVKVQN
jgi:hypothetical protein